MAGHKRQLTGTVVSNKMTKTVVVQVERHVPHSLFKRYFAKIRRFKAHDEKSQCGIGDRIVIEECRPLSRDKRWQVVQVVKKGSGLAPLPGVSAEKGRVVA